MPLFKWGRTSADQISILEENIFSGLSKKPQGRYVCLDDDPEKKVWTLKMNSDKPNSNNIPLVMIHGLGAAVALWSKNLEQLSSNREVYAFDLPGFGRSFRQKFKGELTAEIAENDFVEHIESWRQTMRLNELILLGHSFGGYLASAYALKYPKHVRGLVLVDPWGFAHKVPRNEAPPLFARAILSIYRTVNLNPLSFVRAAGPWGPSMISKFRPDLIRKFGHEHLKDDSVIADYIYHCNAQNPSGEIAFKSLVKDVAWAKNPMIDRIGDISPDIPMIMIIGKDSWVDNTICKQAKEIRSKSIVNFEIIENAGHHVYVDQAETFNKVVRSACLQFEGLKKSIPLTTNVRSEVDCVCDEMMEHIM